MLKRGAAKKSSTLDEIYRPIQGGLDLFSLELKSQLRSDDALIAGIHEHLLKMTGKFLRPALTLFTASLDGKPKKQAVSLAVAVELIHTATLVHDDIIDNSDLRRNQPTVHSKWGREISIVAGDYLYAKAFLLLAGLQDAKVSQAFAACAHLMCEGEMKQIEKRKNFLMPEEEYLKIIHQKTAALFQAACMGGAYFSGADIKCMEALGRYGLNLGMAFQIVDDCLDLNGQTKNLGKKTGLDLDKQDVTLPLLYLFKVIGARERKELFESRRNGGAPPLDQIKKLAAETKSIDRAMQKARGYIDSALGDLGLVKNLSVRRGLDGLARYCVDRVR